MERSKERFVYRFSEVEVDAAGGFLRRDGQDVYLRQQTFRVLVYLLDHRDRLVSKEELREAVWGEVAVGDDAIVQCIAELRRTLGDDPKAARFIRTVPKLGYRFTGSVEQTAVSGPPGAVAPEAVPVHAPEVPSPAAPATPAEREPTPAPAARTRKLPVLVLLLLLLAATAGGSAWLWTRRDAAPPPPDGTRRVAVLDFENRSGTAALTWLQRGLSEMVVSDLARFDRLNLISAAQLAGVSSRQAGGHDFESVLASARRNRVAILVSGSFAAAGEAIRIDARVHDVESGRVIASEVATASRPDEIFATVDLLASRLASRLGVAPPRVPPTDPQQLQATDNLEAYRYYTLGMEYANALRTADAVAMFQKAIELDPRFAMAYARIGYAYAMTAAQPARAKPFLERAFQLSSGLSTRDRARIAAWYAVANQDYDDAIVRMQQMVAHEGDTESHWRLAALLVGEGRLAEAVDVLLKGLELDPDSGLLHNTLGGTYTLLGRHQDAIAAHQRYVALAPKEANAYDSLGLSYASAGRYDDAIREYERALDLDADFEIALVHLGNVYVQRGQFERAVETYQRYRAAARFPEERERADSSIAFVRLRQGRPADAMAVWRRIPKDAQSLIELKLHEKNPDEAERLLLLSRPPWPTRGARLSRRAEYMTRARIVALRGHTEKALAYYRAAVAQTAFTFAADAMETCLGWALLDLKRFTEAAREFERALRITPGHPESLYGLARSLDGAGDAIRARDTYARFIEAWSMADADAPWLVQARSRLAMLQNSSR